MVESIRRPYDREHFVEMIYCSMIEDRRSYYPCGAVKSRRSVSFCNKLNQYCVAEYNYTQDGKLITEETGFAIRRIYNTQTVAVYGKYVNGEFVETKELRELH